MILKVLVPLALPSVFNSLRLLFGLAFGYIMLAEIDQVGGEAGGLGDIINISQRRGPAASTFSSILLIIPAGRPGHRPAAVLGPAGAVPAPLRRRRAC